MAIVFNNLSAKGESKLYRHYVEIKSATTADLTNPVYCDIITNYQEPYNVDSFKQYLLENYTRTNPLATSYRNIKMDGTKRIMLLKGIYYNNSEEKFKPCYYKIDLAISDDEPSVSITDSTGTYNLVNPTITDTVTEL